MLAERVRSDSQKLVSPKVKRNSTSEENLIFRTIDPREIEENIDTQRLL